jgi:hypothetical protein
LKKGSEEEEEKEQEEGWLSSGKLTRTNMRTRAGSKADSVCLDPDDQSETE